MPQVSLAFGRFFGQDMTGIGFFVLYLAAGS
jgi:hypothetical protein